METERVTQVSLNNIKNPMREIIDKVSLQDIKNNVAQVQELSDSIQPTQCHLLLPTPLPSPPHPGFPVSFDLFLTLI